MRINEISVPSTPTTHTVRVFHRLKHVPLYTGKTCSKLAVLTVNFFTDRASKGIKANRARFVLRHLVCVYRFHFPDIVFNFYAGTVILFVRFHIPSQLEFSFHQRRHASDIFAQVSGEIAASFSFTSSGPETEI